MLGVGSKGACIFDWFRILRVTFGPVFIAYSNRSATCLATVPTFGGLASRIIVVVGDVHHK